MDTNEYLNEKNQNLEWIEISEKIFEIYEIKLRNNLITKESFNDLISQTIEIYHIYIDGKYNDIFNKMLMYSIDNHEVYNLIQISEENLHLYHTKFKQNLISKEKFYDLLTENMDLYSIYFQGKNNCIFNKMLKYSIDTNEIYKTEQLDDLVEDKILSYKNMREVINDFDNIIGRYTIYMEKPFGVDSNIILSYYDMNCNTVQVDPKYKYLLEISIIRSDLFNSYKETLMEDKIYSIENLIKMIIYYGDNDSHMKTEWLSLPEKDIPIIKGGFAIWGKEQD